MAASEQCKKAILVFFQQKGGGVARGVSSTEFDLVTRMGFSREELIASMDELIAEEILHDGGRVIFAGKNYL